MLIHFSSMFHIYTPWKSQKTFGWFSDVFREYKNQTLDWNRLKHAKPNHLIYKNLGERAYIIYLTNTLIKYYVTSKRNNVWMDWRFDFLLFKERRNYVAEALYQAFNGKFDRCTKLTFSINSLNAKVVSCRNKSFVLQSKSVDWFLYDRNFCV